MYPPVPSAETARRRRRLLLRSLAVLPIAAMCTVGFIIEPGTTGGAALAAANPAPQSAFAQSLEQKYVDPDRIYSTDVRWWLGEASHTDESLLEEIQALYDGGFRGVELAMQGDNVAPDAVYAYGTDMWTHKWNLMMNKLLDLGMSVYLTSGTNWATSNVPGLDPTSQAAMQSLALGTATVEAGASIGALPTPAESARRSGARFVTAYAYRVVDGNTVDPDSFIDLSGSITQGADTWAQNVAFTAPANGTYRVFAMWTQGTFQTASPSAEPSYATNYFDERGVAALRTFWEEHYLADPELRAKFLEGDVQLFMDSLEMNTGTGFTWWSEDIREQFRERKGYDITPYLFLINGVASTPDIPYHNTGTTGTYKLADEEQRRQGIINDWQDVLTQLYMERMLTPLKDWLNTVGVETRAQISYGKPLEMSEPIMAVDYPEVENFNQYNNIDMFRLHTGGSKLENKVLSSETGAQIPFYNGTAQLDLRDAYSAYASGIQRIVWHVWGAGYSYGNTAWPGHNPASFRQYGTRNPSSADYDEFNAHTGRVQQLLQTGESRTDVGFIKQDFVHGSAFLADIGNDNSRMNWQLAHQGIFYRSTELQDNGYTYDYFSPRFLDDDDVYFDEETKTIEKAGYKAIVLYQSWLDADAAAKILDWTKKGLKVVILEDAGSQTPFDDNRDDDLAGIMTELKGQETVRLAQVFDKPAGGYFSAEPGGYDDNVLEKLQELGVSPEVGYSEPNLQLLTQTREDEDGNQFVYAYNYDDGSYLDKSHKPEVRAATHTTNIQTEIVKEGQFVPYEIDAWTGEVTELAEFDWVDGKTVLPIDLDYNNIKLYAFEKADEAGLRVIDTNAQSARSSGDGVVVRATQSGALETKLSNGKSRSVDVQVPEAYDIRDWDVTVKSWRPNPTAGDLSRTEQIDGVTTTNRKTSTVETPIDVKLDTLTTWDKIPEVGKKVSGTGHYESTFTWDAKSASGAYLDFGPTMESSMKVWINDQKVGGEVSTNPTKVKKDVGGIGKATIDDGRGNQVPLVGDDEYTGGVSWTKPVVDVTPYLKDGENSIRIEYNSVLSNVQLDRGIVTEQTPRLGRRDTRWWGNDQVYLAFGPQQAKIVPFVEKSYDDSMWDVSATATAKALGGKAYVAVSLTNNDQAPVDIEVASPYGTKKFTAVAPGKTVSVSLNSKLAKISAGEVTAKVTGTVDGAPVTETVVAGYGAFPTP